MSINCCYQCITQAMLDELIDEARYDPYAPVNYLDAAKEVAWYERPKPRLWTERNWLGLHSLLTFGEWAEQPLLGDSILGGTPIGRGFAYSDEPIRYFTEKQVPEIFHALQSVSKEALVRTFDPALLNAARVPPEGEWHEDVFEYLWDTFCKIRQFFDGATRDLYAVLVYLC